MFEEAISILSICTSMNSWLTPTVLFLLLNLMIGTIAITSGFSSHNNSNNNNNNNHNNNHNYEFHQQQFQQHQQQQQQQHIQPQISRSNSVLQRLKSINFNNLYTFYTHPPTTHYQSPPPPTHHQPEPESRPEPEPSPVSAEEEEEGDDGEGPTMEEIYSRIKQGNKVSHYGRQNSDTKPSGGEIPVKLPQKMKKSASVKSPFDHFQFQTEKNDAAATNNGNAAGKKAAVVKKVEEKRERVRVKNNASIKEEREEEAVETSVDAKADDFINKFKKQLQLQRNDSILRYKNMISRISAK